MGESEPKVTVGIPIHNGAASIRATIDSVLHQTYRSLEILVVDNASTDDTEAIVTDMASRDTRVRYVRNDENIGQNANFNRVFELARGEYFRWLGDDDSLDARYLERCVAVLDACQEAAVVTTYQTHVKPDGSTIYEEYDGPRPDAPDPMTRLATMLHLMRGSRYWIDPIYSLMRRSLVASSHPIRPLRYGDQIFACELALSGPYEHIPELLAMRSWAPLPTGRTAVAQYTARPDDSGRAVAPRSQRGAMVQILLSGIWRNRGFSVIQKTRGTSAVLEFWLAGLAIRVGRVVRRLAGRIMRGQAASLD